jgi:hypothetical protein
MACFRGSPWSIGTAVKDSVCAVDTGVGWQTSISPGGAQGEGTNSQAYADHATLEAHHLFFGQRSAAGYTEYPGNNAATIKPPNTIWATPIQCATTNAASEGCLGLIGMMSGTGFKLDLSDWHGYALHSTSPYRSTGTRKASDDKDLGADLSAIDRAQTTAPQ